MARTPTLPNLEYATAGDDYSIGVKFTGAAADYTIEGQVRATLGATGDPLATFDVDTQDGAGDDDGMVVVVLTLPGETTAELPELVWCDVQRTADDEDRPVTVLRWRLKIEGQVTQ